MKTRSLDKIKYYMVHHSATVDNPNSNNWQGVINYHINVRKFGTVAYNKGTEYDNGKLITYIGRDVKYKGAHCNDNEMNTIALSHCMVGDFDIHIPSQDMIREVVKCKLEAEKMLGRKLIWRFHRDDNPKTCPGMNVKIDRFIECEEDMINENNITTPSEWAKESWEKAIKKNITDGTNPQENMSREECVVMLDRLGFLD